MIRLSFPNDNAIRSLIAEGLSDYLSFARRLLRYWLESDIDTGLARSPLPRVVLDAAVGMNVKSSRQFRSAIELCERGEAADASVVARSMYETAQAAGFVLKPRFTPRVFNAKGKVTARIHVKGMPLTRQLRAMLWLTHQVLDPEETARRHADRPGMKRHAKRIARLAAAHAVGVQEYKNEIGPEWVKIITSRPWTYSGLSVSNLARSLGRPLDKWYDTVYGSQSKHVHVADMQHYVEFDEAGTMMPRWHESLEYTLT